MGQKSVVLCGARQERVKLVRGQLKEVREEVESQLGFETVGERLVRWCRVCLRSESGSRGIETDMVDVD